jgi:hypothetical protein
MTESHVIPAAPGWYVEETDDNCPVLNGHVSSAGDLARAAAGHIPDTFRP